jgi:membrane protein implicated in regulation of membrane protease activity
MWQIMLIVAIAFLILEIFTPAMFFLNLAISAVITSILSIFIQSVAPIIVIFAILSIVMLLLLRPFLMKLKTTTNHKTGIEEKYIGKIVKVISPISKYSGAITIYGERWEARCDIGEIPIDEEVRIVRNESLVMYVQKIN